MAGKAAVASPARQADRLLYQVARDHLGLVLIAAASTLAAAALTVALPAALAAALDAATARPGAPGGAIARFGALLAAFTAADLTAEFSGPYCGVAATASLRRRLTRRLFAAGPAATRRFAAGDLVGRLVGAAPEAANAPAAVVNAAADVAVSAGGVAALGLIDWRLVAAFAATVPAGLLILRVFVRQTGDVAAEYQRVQGEIAGRLLDALGGIRTIRASGTLDAEAERVLAPLPRLGDAGRRLWLSQRTVGWRSAALLAATQAAVLATCGLGLADGRLTTGQTLAATAYATLGLGFFGSAQAALALARARGAARRLAETEALPEMAYGPRDLPPGPGELLLRAVGVDGPHGPVLDRVELTVPGGTALALVGRSGSGKSALAALAGRLADPDRGTVLLDGVPLPQLSRTALRGAVAYAFERPALLGGSIGETLGFGAAPGEVRAAARTACADGFIRKLPDGYDTPPERAPLSGGQAQRLGLARALVRPGRLVILDDATAGLDTVTEAQVNGAVAAATAGLTRVLVARRPSTAAAADLVAWLEDGRLRALAPHRELWPDPEYRALLGGGPEER